MYINEATYYSIVRQAAAHNATLVAVSKTKPVEAIQELYNLGHRDFGENYVQELVDKYEALPKDIRWHFIGHLQSNKVKYIASFVHLIHAVDSIKLLQEVSKQARKIRRVIDVLLQVHIAQEETKFGFSKEEVEYLLNLGWIESHSAIENVCILGMMGMASLTGDVTQVRIEFKDLKKIYDENASLPPWDIQFETLSMGMSGDYKIALEEGSNMIRIGSLLFGIR